MIWIHCVPTCIRHSIFDRLSYLISINVTFLLHGVFAVDYSILGINDGLMEKLKLTEIPTNIPCGLVGNLDFRYNSITRIEANSFVCLSKITTLDVSYNKITFIALGAFDPLIALGVVRLRGNTDLPELPPNYGPNTANMRHMYIQHIKLQITPPDSYFDQMPMLQELATSIDLGNNFFDGWTNLQAVYSYGTLAPNFTGRTPNIKRIEINEPLPTKNMPNENVVGLTKLNQFKIMECDMLPLFESSIALQTLDVKTCQIITLPDYRHLVSLQIFSPNTSKYHCDTRSCWMRFERIYNTALKTVVQDIICNEPEQFQGQTVIEVSPVQLRCFEGLYDVYHCLGTPTLTANFANVYFYITRIN